jgi:hypothetical protein
MTSDVNKLFHILVYQPEKTLFIDKKKTRLGVSRLGIVFYTTVPEVWILCQ